MGKSKIVLRTRIRSDENPPESQEVYEARVNSLMIRAMEEWVEYMPTAINFDPLPPTVDADGLDVREVLVSWET